MTKMIKYTVDAKNRIVTAEIKNCEQDVVRRLTRIAKCELPRPINKLFIPNVIQAKAKCHPEDEFDEETGKAIARKRLLDKYQLTCYKALIRYNEYSVNIRYITSAEAERVLSVIEGHK